MANYHLVMKNKDKSYSEIEFTKIPEFCNIDSKKLEGIIKFTSFFRNEIHLKDTLLKYRLIKDEDYNRKISITYNYNKQVKSLMYGLTYEDDMKFFDTSYIRYYIKSKMDNLEFLEKLCNHYRNSYIQGTNITIIRNYINYRRNYDELEESQIVDDTLLAIDYFVNMEIYSFDKKNNERKVKYKNLRDLAMFLSYNAKKGKEKKQLSFDLSKAIEEQRDEREEFLTEEDFHSVDQGEDRELDKKLVKKRTSKKKNKDFDGQLSFKDIGWL